MAGLSTLVGYTGNTSAHHFVGITACNDILHNVSVTVDECIARCGTGYHPYSTLEVASAVSSWVIPLFVLVGNIELSNLQVGTSSLLWGLRRSSRPACVLNVCVSYGVVLARLMGNPIQFLWSHLERLEHMRYRRMHSVDPDVTVLAIALDDFSSGSGGGLGGQIDTYIRSLPAASRAAFLTTTCRPAAANLADNRISSMRRSALTVAAYTAVLFVSLGTSVAQRSEAVHTPHTIALREVCYWLVSAGGLRSAAGGFATRRSAKGFLRPVLEAMGNGAGDANVPKVVLAPLGVWTGGSYAFTQVRELSVSAMLRLGVSLVVVMGAWVFSFITSWFTPTRGLGCRSLMELCYLAVWIANFVVSFAVTRIFPEKWPVITSVLDLCVAVPAIVCLFAAFKGWYNSCKCWGAGFTPVIEHWIPQSIQQQEYDLTSMYYGLVGGAVGFQVVMSACVLWYYRQTLYLIYGSTRDDESAECENVERSEMEDMQGDSDADAVELLDLHSARLPED